MFSANGRLLQSSADDDVVVDPCRQWDLVEAVEGQTLDRLGESVLFSGDGSVLAIAGGGLLSINSRSFVRLYQVQNDRKVRQLGNQIDGRNEFDNRRRSVDLSFDGTIVAFGERGFAINDGAKGRVRIFQYSDADGDWVQLGQDLEEEDQSLNFGEAVSLSDDGSVLAVGETIAGNVYIYQFQDQNWTQVYTIRTPSDGGRCCRLGSTVSLSGDGTILAAGDPLSNGGDGNTLRGSVRLYQFVNTSGWKEWKDAITGEENFESIGQRILLASDGHTLVASLNPQGSTTARSASARVYQLNLDDSQWKSLGNDIRGESASGATDRAGISFDLSADGRSIAVGSPGGAGHARVYRYQSSVDEWLLVGDETVGGSPGDQYGSSIALSFVDSQTYLAVGARFHDRSRTNDNAGLVRLFEVNSTCFREQLDLERKESAVDQLGIRLVMVESGIDQAAISTFEEISMNLFDTFFEKTIPTVQGMVSRFSVNDHNVNMGNATIEFSIRMVYVESSGSNLTATDLLFLPFNDSGFNSEYWQSLSQVDAFAGLRQPIESPFLVELDNTVPNSMQGKSSNPIGRIAGVVIGAVVLAMVVALIAFRRFKQNLPEGIIIDGEAENSNNYVGDAVLAVDAELVDNNNDRNDEPRGFPGKR